MNSTEEISEIDRKKDHIDLAFNSQVSIQDLDSRFNYEPMLAGHAKPGLPDSFDFVGHQLKVPIWVSSMTGGTGVAKRINENLARACKQFGMGMGLGSCRPILKDLKALPDFDVRAHIGDQPLYANLGIAQIEESLSRGRVAEISQLVDRLSANGLIVHVNPMQEWLQPEGDRIQHPPIETIKRLLDETDLSIIVKEVGQGMGPASLAALMKLPLTAIEFAAHGGTNFALLEMMRSDQGAMTHKGLAQIGHSAEQMVDLVNEIMHGDNSEIKCKEFIISGGIKDYLTGYYLINKINSKAIYGQASSLLKYAQNSYEELEGFLLQQTEGLKLAQQYLSIKSI